MLKSIYLFSCLFVLFILTSCSEKITLSNDQKETAVIYALLDQADTIHYIKINRAFSGTNNSLEVAQIPDSSYFKDVQAYVYEIKQGDTLRKWKLRDTLITNKEAGIFYGPTQKVYYFETSTNNPLVGEIGRNYVFHGSFDNNKFSVTGSTELIYGNTLGSPTTSGTNYSFANGNLDKPEFYSTSIKFKPGTAVTTNTTIRVSFREYIGLNYTVKTFDWNVGDLDVTAGEAMTGISALGSAFYPLIAQNCTKDPNITKRQLEALELRVTFGSDVLKSYMDFNKPSSSIAQNKVNYTNLSATNDMRVLGIFTCRNVKTHTKLSYQQIGLNFTRALDSQSTKELCMGATTGLLLFCSDVPADINTSFHCK
jgi:hypothetical protein